MLLPVISTKKPVSLPPWKKESPRPSAASLSKKKKWTPALKPCSSPNAHSLDRSSRRRFREHQELSSKALPAFRGTDRPDNLPAYPFPENLTEPGQTRPPQRHKRTCAYAAPVRRGLRGESRSRRNPAHPSRCAGLAIISREWARSRSDLPVFQKSVLCASPGL